MILDINNREVANWSQVTVAFDSEDDYNTWVNTLPNKAADVAKFVVFKCWENQNDRAVQFYKTSALFPKTGNTNTIYLDLTAWQMYSWNSTSKSYIPLATAGGNADMVVGMYNAIIGMAGDPRKLYYAYDTHELLYFDADAGTFVKFLGTTGDNPVLFVNTLPAQGGQSGILYIEMSTNLPYRWGDNKWQLIGHENAQELVFFNTFPATGDSNKLYIDNVDGIIYRWNGEKFTAINDTGYKISFVEELPSYGQSNILYINTTNRRLYHWNGVRFVLLGGSGASSVAGDYESLLNVPFINGFEVKPGNQDGHDLGLANWVDLLNLQKLADHLYNAEYTTYSYDAAKEYFSKYDAVAGGCSTFAKVLGSSGKYVGRNYDYYYNNAAEYVIRTKAIGDKHATLGTAEGSDSLTDYVASDGRPDLFYEILPYLTVDGINDAGLVVTINIVSEEDCGTWTGTNYGVAGCTRVAASAVPRYLLDNCATAKQAVDYLKTKLDIYMLNNKTVTNPNGLQLAAHYFIADESTSFVVEVKNNQVFVTASGGSVTYPGATDFPSTNPDKNNHRQIMTNFYLNGWNGDIKSCALGDTVDEVSATGINQHPWGLERYKAIDEAYDTIASVEDMKTVLKSIDYTHAYKSPSPEWYSDFAVGSLTVYTGASGYAAAINSGKAKYASRNRNTALTWQTVHNAIYSIKEKTMLIRTQENAADEWKLEVLSDASGVSSYTFLTNKPTLNGVEINGDKTSSDYNLMSKEEIQALLSGARSIVKVEQWPLPAPEKPVPNTLYYVVDATRPDENIYNVYLQGTYPEEDPHPENYAIDMGSTEVNLSAYQTKKDTQIIVPDVDNRVNGAINALYNTYINGVRVFGNLSGDDLGIAGNLISGRMSDWPMPGDPTKVYFDTITQKLYKYTDPEHGYMEIVSKSGIVCDTLMNILSGVAGTDPNIIYYATDAQDIYKYNGSSFEIAANFAQPTVVFDSESAYQEWLAQITLQGESVDNYVVFENWEVDCPVQCYYNQSYFPTVGRKHTIYIDCSTMNQYLWHYQDQHYVLLASGSGSGSGGSSTIDYTELFKKIYPVGSIYLTMMNTNPEFMFGGSWTLISQGRTLVGVNPTDGNYSRSGIVGGAESVSLGVDNMPSHSHETGSAIQSIGLTWQSYRARYSNQMEFVHGMTWGSGRVGTFATGGGRAHNNMQPYFTCYIWQRTA